MAAKLPALAETPVPCDHVGNYMVKFLDAMYRAREIFHAANVRAKVELAKRSRPSNHRKVELVTGDTVFYYESLERGKDSLHGPAVVIEADGDFVVLRHGGRVRRVPLLHCRPASAVLGSADVDPEVAPVGVPDETQQELEELLVDEAGKELSAEDVAELRRMRDDREPVVTRSRARAAMSVLTRLGPGLPELVWQRYTSVLPPSISGEVFLSYCYVAHCSARRGMTEVTPEKAQSLDFVMEKQKDLASWVACHVYDLVPDNGQKAILCQWVLVDKVQDDDSLKPKARLVVRGLQEAGPRDLDTFSPTCSKSSSRVLLTVASHRGWAPIAVDISTAFLQGGALQREVYVRPPQELHAPGQLLKLREAVYGLVDAPLHWYQALHKAMLSTGAIVVPFDLAIYVFRDNENLCGWAAAHVDDISIAGTDSLISSVLEALHGVFSVGSEKREEYVFCRVHLECKCDDDGNLIEITLD